MQMGSYDDAVKRMITFVADNIDTDGDEGNSDDCDGICFLNLQR